MTDLNATAWAGLCAVTESDEPHEWVPILWVVRNRVAAPGRFRDTVAEVVRQRWQFSAFNSTRAHADAEAFRIVSARNPEWTVAERAAAYVFDLPSWRAPFGHRVCHFWSRVSMVPAGSDPSWAEQAERIITLPGIDPDRFMFAEGVP